MSLNALKTGLYAARDFIRPGEEEEYAHIRLNLIDELAPKGILEETFATEIMGATWRLRRCRMVEATFSSGILDPMIDEEAEKQQKSVDRARAQAHNILRRSLAELRKLQAERQAKPEASVYQPNPFCKPTNQTPRNVQCSCGSGVKCKRCCGKDVAPPVPRRSAVPVLSFNGQTSLNCARN